MRILDDLRVHVRRHRCSTHPIFEHWSDVDPEPAVVGALLHQIQLFCAAARPAARFPEALRRHGLTRPSQLIREIAESAERDGSQLATMAGYILNRSARRNVCPDLYDREAVEAKLKELSDELLGSLPGYDSARGLTMHARRAIQVFERRGRADLPSTLCNLGTALALEMITNRHLIPGEKHCLVDSGLYGVSLDDTEMRYLLEHWAERGAEGRRERRALEAVASVLSADTEDFVVQGMHEVLETLAALWDVLDSALLHSGYVPGSSARALVLAAR